VIVPEIERLLGEAVDALLDAEQQHQRELRKLAEQLGKRPH
jgi:rubrerythrin